jgi:hypothetical protein
MTEAATRAQTALAVLAISVAASVLSFTGVAWASNWKIGLAGSSQGTARSGATPDAPTQATAVCDASGKKRIMIVWTAVAHASSYSIYESTTSATSGYTLANTGVTGTAWTSGNLKNGTHWFEVVANAGTFWVSPGSAAMGPFVVSMGNCA